MLHPKRLTAPASLPVDLSLFKSHLRILTDHEDVELATYLQAAVDHLDGWSGRLGRCLITQTWVQAYEGWPSARHFVLPMPDVSAADLIIRYLDVAGDWQTLPSSSYFDPVSKSGVDRICIKSSTALPSLYSGHPAPIEVQFKCGYGDAQAVPADLRAAICLIGAHLYSARETFIVGAVINDNPQIDRILRNHQAGMRI